MQAWPQLPQFRLSEAVSTQLPPHWVLPPGQPPAWQVASRQASPLAQAWPQAPQLAGSLAVLVQRPASPHWVCPDGQLDAHLPLTQARPLAQDVPHLPQFAGSVPVLVQAPLHAVWPVAQTSWQLPFWHVLAPVQALPQPPQFWLSEEVLVQLPLQSTERPEQLPPLLPPEVVLVGGALGLQAAATRTSAENAEKVRRRMWDLPGGIGPLRCRRF